jgi:predicted small metal-binding protein
MRTRWANAEMDRLNVLIIIHPMRQGSKGRMRRIVVPKEAHMARMFVDCRDYPSEMNCTVAISADTKNELLEAAVQHAVAVHGHHDSPQLRQELAKIIKTQ